MTKKEETLKTIKVLSAFFNAGNKGGFRVITSKEVEKLLELRKCQLLKELEEVNEAIENMYNM